MSARSILAYERGYARELRRQSVLTQALHRVEQRLDQTRVGLLAQVDAALLVLVRVLVCGVGGARVVQRFYALDEVGRGVGYLFRRLDEVSLGEYVRGLAGGKLTRVAQAGRVVRDLRGRLDQLLLSVTI